MKYVTFKTGEYISFGILQEKGVYDLGARVRSDIPDLKSFLAAEASGLLKPQRNLDTVDFGTADFTYLPVVFNPTKILCVGLNYEDHRAETGRAATEHPAIFTRYADTLVGHEAPIILPSVSSDLDFEGELAVVIGRNGFRITEADAPDYVAGYSVFNDASLRDWQRHTPQFTPGKNFPRTGAFGPALVTGVPLSALESKKIETRLNGQVMQSAHLGDMIFSVPKIISYVSSFTPLSPGDVIATGTPGGVGFKRNPPLYMHEGDTIEVSIEGLGTLMNVIKSENTHSD